MATKKTTKAPKAKKGFTPTPAPVAPAGTYDPSLDAGQRAANRGLLYTTQDNERDAERLGSSYTTGMQQSQQARSGSLADLLTGKTRATTDLATALGRSKEDYGRLSGDLQRNYAELGAGQTAKASSGAFVDAGSIAAAGAARGANQTRDQGVLDTNENRFEADNGLQLARVGEDYGTGVQRANEQFDAQDAGLAQSLQYGTDDLATTLSRATTENNFYGQDVGAAKMYQATSSGLYTPPQKPANEFSDAKGPYKLLVAHGLRFKLRPNGTKEPAGVSR